MTRLLADEDFPRPVVEELRRLGHDVQTVGEAGKVLLGVADAILLEASAADHRAVLTHNHADFRRLHRKGLRHAGIISCSQDPHEHVRLALRIHQAIANFGDLENRFIRVIRPNPSMKP